MTSAIIVVVDIVLIVNDVYVAVSIVIDVIIIVALYIELSCEHNSFFYGDRLLLFFRSCRSFGSN